MRLGHYIIDQGAHLAQKLLAHISELVVIFVKLVMEKNHLHEPQVAIVDAVEAVEAIECPGNERGLIVVFEGGVLDPLLAQRQSSQKISVLIGLRSQVCIRLQSLDICFHQRRVVVHVVHQPGFLLEDALRHSFTASGRGSSGGLGGTVHRPGSNVDAHDHEKNANTVTRTHIASIKSIRTHLYWSFNHDFRLQKFFRRSRGRLRSIYNSYSANSKTMWTSAVES